MILNFMLSLSLDDQSLKDAIHFAAFDLPTMQLPASPGVFIQKIVNVFGGSVNGPGEFILNAFMVFGLSHAFFPFNVQLFRFCSFSEA
jgi:hypothetical protein